MGRGEIPFDFSVIPDYTQHGFTRMSPLVAQVSKALHLSPKELLRGSVLSYLEREIRLAEEDIADVRDKYLVLSRQDLLRKIKTKSVASHPAWEDLITWENLESHLRTLRKTLDRLR